MKVNDLKKEGSLVTLELEENYSELSSYVDIKYKKEVKNLKIPGFRKGKAPKGIFISYYGKEKLDFDALIDMLNAKYPTIVQENKLEVIDQPKDFDIIQLEEDKPIKVKLSVEVKPEAKISKYKGLKLEKELVKVTDADVQAELEALADKHIEYDFDDGAKIKEGDLITANIKAVIGSEEYAPWTRESDVFKAGKSIIGPKFDEAIYGLKANDEKTFSIEFPKDAPNKDIAHKAVEFTVVINKVKSAKVPKITDEFIAEQTESMSLADFKKETEEKLRANMELASENKLKEDVSKWVIENVKVDVPRVMIEREIDYLIKRMENGLRMYNMGIESYLNIVQKSIDDLRKDYEKEATDTVQLRLGLEAIASLEEIKATDKDIEEEIEESIKDQKDESIKADYRKQLESVRENIAESVINKKVIDFLLENAKIKKKNK
ncbi:MAG: trigger factor [Candidatus Margulisbacteria bacterium]|nr:trigger factor [Candidatus Margulisiibacteriota bacterium]